MIKNVNKINEKGIAGFYYAGLKETGNRSLFKIARL